MEEKTIDVPLPTADQMQLIMERLALAKFGVSVMALRHLRCLADLRVRFESNGSETDQTWVEAVTELVDVVEYPENSVAGELRRKGLVTEKRRLTPKGWRMAYELATSESRTS